MGSAYPAEEIIVHPNYTTTVRGADAISLQQIINDIALVKVNGPITLDERTSMPVCLPHAGHVDTHFKRCYVTGWGQKLPERGMLTMI